MVVIDEDVETWEIVILANLIEEKEKSYPKGSNVFVVQDM